jgi:pyridoxal phosphate enzyme (YggS family)
MMMNNDLLRNAIHERFRVIVTAAHKAAEACGRNAQDISVIAVSKTQPYEVIQAALDAGIRVFGENYAQELRDKGAAFVHHAASNAPEWHYIGHLQTNKVRMILPVTSWIHSVDSEKLAREIDKEAAKLGKVVNVLLQVNTSGEQSKSGCQPQEVFALAEAALRLPHLHVQGLMTIAALDTDPEVVRPMFRHLRLLRDELRTKFHGISYFGGAPQFAHLSMGMTNDFAVAIEEGATMIRVGTAIFGARGTA